MLTALLKLFSDMQRNCFHFKGNTSQTFPSYCLECTYCTHTHTKKMTFYEVEGRKTNSVINVILFQNKLMKLHLHTLQLNLIFRTLNQNRADRIQVVIVTAAKRTSPRFCYLMAREWKSIYCIRQNRLRSSEAHFIKFPFSSAGSTFQT